jgi:hypothetical protein
VVLPCLFHKKLGEPPPVVGVSVNVTQVPPQTLVALAPTLTAGVTVGFTVITKWVDVAVVGEAQLALLVITTQTVSLLEKPVPV